MTSTRSTACLKRSLLAGLLIVSLAGAACGSHSASSGASSRPDLATIFEAEPQLHADPAGTLSQLRRLGADTVRAYVAWKSIAPAPASKSKPSFDAADPGAYPASSWAIYDQIVSSAQKTGVKVYFTVGGPPPLWAAGPSPPRGGPFPYWRPSAAEYGLFVHALGRRYSGSYRATPTSSPLPRVSFWSIWNEPNYGPELAPQAVDHSTVEVSPLLYRGLLDAGWSSLQATGHGADTILIGETAPRGLTAGDNPGTFSGMVPLRFLRALYCLNSSFHKLSGQAAALRGCPTDSAGGHAFAAMHPALFRASGYADHPYPQGLPPNVVIPYEPDYADLATIPRLEQTLDRVQAAYGSGKRFPIYNTEFGYQTDPPEKIAHSVDPNAVAEYLNWAEYISWRDHRIRSYDQYQLTDPPAANALGGFATGLEFKDGTAKASLAAFRLPLFLPVSTARRGTALELWGHVRPAGYARQQTHLAQRVQIQFARGTSTSFETLRTLTLADPRGYFDTKLSFPVSGAVRLAWSYPDRTTIYSRTASVALR